ncbi:polymer-forming cytoskeletal protein [Paraburkholderia sp. BL10I2N1]|uniref:bactofilin family protein n=1 Tax=Paraburkholderia sp. BL10I2N1 TaxID=1938796 RepID=UPI00105BB1A3|nr:polymer-forming cytoskeletal protein [Paraburkholderia sp. BL10I2N1]TDN59015.1 polymer-forming protein [Paraburkholderia sp. BL10I2N1]
MKAKQLNVTLLAAGATIHGDVILDHGLSTFGIVSGCLIANTGLLHVGPGGLVKGGVEGEHVRIDGSVDGDVHARSSLEINGRVKGNVFYGGTIRLGPRAALDGKISRSARELTVENAADNVQQLPRQASAS